jgi:preprotein translocase subunit SecA
VLNAKNHAREADIVAQAGRLGAVTVATNMAGRGVDIMLGGNPEEMARIELKLAEPESDPRTRRRSPDWRLRAEVRGASSRPRAEGQGARRPLRRRHRAARVAPHRQPAARSSGRQGDPGESRFYLSLEDDLMRLFNATAVENIMTRLKIPEDVPIEHKMVTKAVERAQRQVESQNFEIRKNVLKYDEVMNEQRKVIYEWRQRVLLGEDIESLVRGWLEEVVEGAVLEVISDEVAPRDWDAELLHQRITQVVPLPQAPDELVADADETVVVVERATQLAQDFYTARADELGPDMLRRLERHVVLSIVDNKWREHLAEMDYLRSGVGLRAMGQRDPLVEYQREGFDMFSDMVVSIKEDSIRYICHAQFVEQQSQPEPVVRLGPAGAGRPAVQRQASASDKVGRNEPCPCGSGKKYKKCHGAVA